MNASTCPFALAAEPHIELTRHKPCNLFGVDGTVRLEATVQGVGKDAEAALIVTDYFGARIVDRKVPLPRESDKATTLPIELGALPAGYYELRVAIADKTLAATSFAVAAFTDRAAAQVRAGGYRFGLKIWFAGEIWWNRKLHWDAGEVVTAFGKLGLQWTRALITQKEYLSTQDLMTQFPMNVILKIESFPEDCYDEARYGSREAFIKTPEGRAWNKNTLPKEAPYKAWLKTEVAKIPPEQNVFELWNEPWQWEKTLTATDFAKLCNWTVEAIREVRPEAVIGPNIYGELEPYDLTVMRAGGLKGMDMVAIHPYTAGTPEAKGFRQRMRNYHDLITRETGRDLDLYTTEYGWATAPQGDRCVSEKEQARLTVRESLMLYAEGVKTLIPHTMGQREQNPKEREDYFGFFRLNQEPKPVVVAHAVSAQMIDGSRFVGDLSCGPGIGAMLFERDGIQTLAVWTEAQEKPVEFDVKTEKLTAVDIMGRAKPVETKQGRLALTVGPDVTYLVGIGKELTQDVVTPALPLIAELWKPRAGSYSATRVPTPPSIDGTLTDWNSVAAVKMENPKLDDLRATAQLSWDAKALYLAVHVDDTKIINANAPENIRSADCLDFRICTRPDRQVTEPGLYDYQVLVAPASATGKPALILKNRAKTDLISPAADHASGIQWAVTTNERGWNVELALPWKALPGAENGPLPKLSFAVAVFDRDTTATDEWKQWHKRVYNFDPKNPASEQPWLVLEPSR
jgi:hypothetical protein